MSDRGSRPVKRAARKLAGSRVRKLAVRFAQRVPPPAGKVKGRAR